MARQPDLEKLQRERAVLLGVPITDETAHEVISQLLFLQMDHAKLPITLFINSPGGSVTATLAIYDTMQFLKAPLITYNIGQAHSAACLLLAAGHRGRRWMKSGAEVGFSCLSSGGAGRENAAAASFLGRLSQHWSEILLKHTNLTSLELEQFSSNNTLLTADHALRAGIVDHIADS